ncbi:MAG: EAL domain-containing protein [Cytophaga sp.]|nr:EAL domain-containing protein [Undibacterium sp.]
MMSKDALVTREVAKKMADSDASLNRGVLSSARLIVKWLPWLVLVLGMVVTATLWQSERDNEARQLQTKFDSLVRQTEALISERIGMHEQVLRGVKSLFVASDDVSRREFHDYVVGLHLEEHYQGIQGVGFSKLLSATKNTPLVNASRLEDTPDFSIQLHGEYDLYTTVIDPTAHHQFKRQALRDDVQIEKLMPRLGDSAQGLRYRAMEQARDTGKTMASGKVKLLMEMDAQARAGFLMYLPVYKNGTAADTPETRRANLQGWVYAPFSVDDLMARIIGERRNDMEIKIYDGQVLDDSSLLYSLGAWHTTIAPEIPLESSRSMDIFGRSWTVVIRSVPGFGAELIAGKAIVIASTGASMSLLFALLTWLLARSRTRAIVTAMALQHELDERKKVLHALHDSEAFSRATINAISEHICVIDQSGTVLTISDIDLPYLSHTYPAIHCMVGDNYFSKCEFVFGMDEKKSDEVSAGMRSLIDGEKAFFSFEYSCGTTDAIMFFLVNITRFSDDDNKLVVVQADISERKRGEESLRLAASVFDNVIEAIIVTDANCNIIAINPAFTQITGYGAAEVLGKNPRFLQSGRHDATFYQEMWRCLNTSGKWQGEVWNKSKDGTLIADWASISTVVAKDGMVERYVAVFCDVTENKKMEKLVWDQANFDALTSLPNRLLFLDRLSMEIYKAETHDLSFALFFIDLDNFKDVNETLGHHIGDALLIQAGQRIATCLRLSDTVARLGGDEFSVLLTEVNDPAKIEAIVQEVLDRMAEPFLIGDDKVYLTASVGITLYPDDATVSSDLFKNADQALYVAKNAGRNRFSYFTKTMEESARVRLQTLTDLRGAIAADQLKVYFQPIVDLTTNKVIKAEALLRWFHPSLGMISPAEFIPIAEESGLIHDIGDWVFKESALWAQRWSKQIGQPFQISVNKSPIQFYAKSKYTSWTEYLQLLGLPGKCICVEITEGLLLSAGVGEKLQEYNKSGIQVSIDDFGTGYSSMSYLKKFTVDYLKIDQSFVRDMEHDETDRAIAEAIILMAHKLGIKVIAEGIETEGQRDLLMAAGCDCGQGYLFSKAISPAEFESLFIQTRYSESIL